MKYSAKLTALSLTAVGFLTSTAPVLAQTQPWDSPGSICVSETDPDVATIHGLQCLVANLLSTFLTIVGIAAFIMMVVASFRILFSGGNSQSVEKAKNSITYAVIGLVVAVGAFVILNLIAEFTGVQAIKTFKIPFIGN